MLENSHNGHHRATKRGNGKEVPFLALLNVHVCVFAGAHKPPLCMCARMTTLASKKEHISVQTYPE